MSSPLKHFASPDFWKAYERLPKSIQKTEDKNFSLLKQQQNQPSIRLKKAGAESLRTANKFAAPSGAERRRVIFTK